MKQKITPYKLDTTSDLKAIKPDSFVDAVNIRVTDSVSSSGSDYTGDAGVIKNVLGNIASDIVNDFDSLTTSDGVKYRVLGSTTDSKAKIIYFFVWSSQSTKCGVYAYDHFGRLPKNSEDGSVQPKTVRLIIESKFLKFPQSGFVKGDIVHINRSEFEKYENIKSKMEALNIWSDMNSDAILYFTDNVNEPKKINVYRALLDNSYQDAETNTTDSISGYLDQDNRDFLMACPRTPLKQITAEFDQDNNFNGSNFKDINGLQFAYQWVYKDGIESSVSVYSKVYVPPVRISQGSQPYVNYTYNNRCKLRIPSGSREVEKIRILVRESEESSFLFIDEINKGDGLTTSYDFYNNKTLIGVSEELVSKQFDNVPQSAESQVTSNNRLFYGNYTSGFDSVDVKAIIKPVAGETVESPEIDIKVVPRTRVTAYDSDGDDYKYPGGASFIIDASGVNYLSQGQTISFSMTVSPDKNFHVYSKYGYLPFKSNADSLLYSQNPEKLSYPLDGDPEQLYITNPSEYQDLGITECDYYYKDEDSTSTSIANVKIGSYFASPLILKGGSLSFSCSFEYQGQDLSGEEASDAVAVIVREIITGQENYTYPINVLSGNHEFVHSIDLGLSNFDSISASVPDFQSENSLEPSDYSFLICNVPANNNPFQAGRIAYYIVNQAKVKFSLVHAKNKPSVPDSIQEVVLALNSIDEIQVHNCIARPSASKWTVITRDYFENSNSNNEAIEGFISAYGQESLNNLIDFYDIPQTADANISFSFPGLENYKKQFGYLDFPTSLTFSNNPIDDDYDNHINQTGLLVVDGESGLGTETNKNMYKCGTVPKFFISLNPQNGLIGNIDIPSNAVNQAEDILDSILELSETNQVNIPCGMYFGGGSQMLAFIPSGVSDNIDTAVFLHQKVNSFDLVLGGHTESSGSYVAGFSNEEEKMHSQIEVISNPTYSYNVDLSDSFKSFKSSAYHDFGVVYYDERGRHGFVNEIGSVYAPGYSNVERSSSLKGPIYMNVLVTSTPPSWARYWKLVHSRSSIDSFIQYSAGGAFTALENSDSTIADEQNIYVSLNYLQGSKVSYVNSFGARNPEGSVLMYSFSPGDRVRVISYETSDGVIVYPYKFEFDVIDMRILGEDNNPLHSSNSIPPNNKTGHFLVLKDNITANGFDYGSVFSENHFWGNNCVIEIFSPKKSEDRKFYYEIGETQEIENESHGGYVLVKDGDVWWRQVAVNVREDVNEDIILDIVDDSGTDESKSNFKTKYLESSTSSDLTRANAIGRGRPNTVLKEEKRIRHESSIIYSDPTGETNIRFKYSSFNPSLLNFKDLDSSFGNINYLVNKDSGILAMQEDKISFIPISRNILSTSSGQNMVVSSRDVLGDTQSFPQSVGAASHPESVVDTGARVYFVHAPTSSINYFDGSKIKSISNKGMAGYFRDLITEQTAEGSYKKFIGGYDPINEEYLLTPVEYVYSSESDSYEEFPFDAQRRGCMDPSACNYDEFAIVPGPCEYPSACYDCDGNQIQDPCLTEPIYGCMDPEASNYSPVANTPDGSCQYLGCTDPEAYNYDPQATNDDGSCVYCGCTDSTAINYDESTLCDNNDLCLYKDFDSYVKINGITIGNLLAIKIYGVDLTKFYSNDSDLDGQIGTSDLLSFLSTFNVEYSQESYVVNPLLNEYSFDFEIDYNSNLTDLNGNVVPYDLNTSILFALRHFEVTYSELKTTIESSYIVFPYFNLSTELSSTDDPLTYENINFVYKTTSADLLNFLSNYQTYAEFTDIQNPNEIVVQ
jgi:hypothetical protein